MHRLKNDLNLINLAASHTGTQIEIGELVSALEGIEQIQQAAASMATVVKSIMATQNHAEIFRVLLAEDNPNQRILIGNALRKAGFFVAEVGDGNEAIEYIYQMTEPDIILTDVAMPHCDGNELVNVARTSPMCTHSLVVAMTGRPLSDELRKKVDHVIMKPLDPEALVAELKKLLQRRDQAENNAAEIASPDHSNS
ncbi:MAG: response regulator [Fuerstiella sp.]